MLGGERQKEKKKEKKIKKKTKEITSSSSSLSSPKFSFRDDEGAALRTRSIKLRLRRDASQQTRTVAPVILLIPVDSGARMNYRREQFRRVIRRCSV